jgi:hypothetical protein
MEAAGVQWAELKRDHCLADEDGDAAALIWTDLLAVERSMAKIEPHSLADIITVLTVVADYLDNPVAEKLMANAIAGLRAIIG